LIPEVSSVFFSGHGEMIISSYGRGLWKYNYDCSGRVIRPPSTIDLAEPLIYWKGAKVPISQIHDPDVCPVCGYFLNVGGRILDYRMNADTNQLAEVMISGGEMKGYTWDGSELPVQFKVSIGDQIGELGGDKELQALLTEKNMIKGLFLEGNTMRGLILYSNDLAADQLPKKSPLAPHITVDLSGPQDADNLKPIIITGAGFNPQFALEILLDGRVLQLEQPVKFDEQGDFMISIPPLIEVGGHTILIRQETDKGIIQDASTFLVTVKDTQ
jgi:hypothetical protein